MCAGEGRVSLGTLSQLPHQSWYHHLFPSTPLSEKTLPCVWHCTGHQWLRSQHCMEGLYKHNSASMVGVVVQSPHDLHYHFLLEDQDLIPGVGSNIAVSLGGLVSDPWRKKWGRWACLLYTVMYITAEWQTQKSHNLVYMYYGQVEDKAWFSLKAKSGIRAKSSLGRQG